MRKYLTEPMVEELLRRAVQETRGFLAIGSWPGRRSTQSALERRGLMAGLNLTPRGRVLARQIMWSRGDMRDFFGPQGCLELRRFKGMTVTMESEDKQCGD